MLTKWLLTYKCLPCLGPILSAIGRFRHGGFMSDSEPTGMHRFSMAVTNDGGNDQPLSAVGSSLRASRDETDGKHKQCITCAVSSSTTPTTSYRLAERPASGQQAVSRRHCCSSGNAAMLHCCRRVDRPSDPNYESLAPSGDHSAWRVLVDADPAACSNNTRAFSGTSYHQWLYTGRHRSVPAWLRQADVTVLWRPDDRVRVHRTATLSLCHRRRFQYWRGRNSRRRCSEPGRYFLKCLVWLRGYKVSLSIVEVCST